MGQRPVDGFIRITDDVWCGIQISIDTLFKLEGALRCDRWIPYVHETIPPDSCAKDMM